VWGGMCRRCRRRWPRSVDVVGGLIFVELVISVVVLRVVVLVVLRVVVVGSGVVMVIVIWLVTFVVWWVVGRRGSAVLSRCSQMQWPGVFCVMGGWFPAFRVVVVVVRVVLVVVYAGCFWMLLLCVLVVVGFVVVGVPWAPRVRLAW
jgi:hypothetical protein